MNALRSPRRWTLVALGLGLLACPAQPRRAPPGPAPKPGRGPENTVPALPPASACADAPLVTLEQIAAGERAGERVALEAVPQATVTCTAMACVPAIRAGERLPPQPKPEDVCCNQCGGSYELRFGERLVVRFEGLGQCTGMDCNFRCEPFGWKPTERYRFVGTNAFAPAYTSGAIYAVSTFTVEKVCRVE